MEKKKSIILTIVAVATLIALVVGATYAYFQATGGQSANANVNVTTYTTDLLTFTTGNAISIYADQSNFAEGLGNQNGETFARAHLLANNKTNTAKDNYYVYLDITKNNFEYTQGSTPELLLQIADTNGVEVTTLSGLEYKAVTDGKGQTIKGFDVTTAQGLITIVDNHEISANPEKEETWNVSIVFVNLDADQTKNTGKSLTATLKIQKESESTGTLADWVKAQYTGVQGENNIYFHNGTILGEDGAVLDAEDNSYRYAGGGYELTQRALNENYKYVVSSNAEDNNALLKFKDSESDYFYDYTEFSRYQYDSVSILSYNGEQYDTIEEALEQALLDGYLKQNNVNNYVCFGSDAATCPEDNLYRIIGVFGDQVKLIKANYASSDLLGTDGAFIRDNMYAWRSNFKNFNEETDYSNDWSAANLNTINLNKNYLNNVGEKWANKIVTTTWMVGGDTSSEITNGNTKHSYQNEIVSPNTEQVKSTYDAKIGLMYVSDYLYGHLSDLWNKSVESGYFDVNERSLFSNWLHAREEWTITRTCWNLYGNELKHVYYVTYFGNVGSWYANGSDTDNGEKNIRPVFYLNSDVTKVGNNAGTKTDPIRLS